MGNWFFKARLDWYVDMQEMTMEERGLFFTAIYAYATGSLPVDVPEKLKIPVRAAIRQLVNDRDLQNNLSVVRAECGRKGAEKTNTAKRQKSANAVGKSQQLPNSTTPDVSESITANAVGKCRRQKPAIAVGKFGR